MHTKITSYNIVFLSMILGLLLIPVSISLAQSEGIPLEKDVFLEWPIIYPKDLPDQVTFNLYASQDALAPIATQTFPRGAYTVEFEFSKSDGLTLGTVARFKANFTQTLNLINANGETLKPKELWTDLALDGTLTGTRKQVSDDIMVQLLLNSDASISTYLTLVYKGDQNPITTIYRDLPLSLKSSNSSGFPFNSYFSPVLGTYPSGTGPAPSDVAGSDGQIQYNNSGVQAGANQFYYDDINHRVGIGTASPQKKLHVKGSDILARFEGENEPAIILFVDGSETDPTGRWAIQAGMDGIHNIFSIYEYTAPNQAGWASRFCIHDGGNVGIGTRNPSHRLSVNGAIKAREIMVTNTGWSDFVFEGNYRLPPLSEVERFISENKHLPGIPSEAEVKEKGVTLGNISSKLLQKIEELTLYVIDLKKENESLKSQIAVIHKKLESQN